MSMQGISILIILQREIKIGKRTEETPICMIERAGKRTRDIATKESTA